MYIEKSTFSSSQLRALPHPFNYENHIQPEHFHEMFPLPILLKQPFSPGVKTPPDSIATLTFLSPTDLLILLKFLPQNEYQIVRKKISKIPWGENEKSGFWQTSGFLPKARRNR